MKQKDKYNYWEKRYKAGGHSGKGRKGLERWWKQRQIRKYTNANDVIDVGCGDLDFWQGKKIKNYIGIDVSESLLKKNKKKRSQWKFILSGGEVTHNIFAKDVFCFEMLYHIMDDKSYVEILENLTKYSTRYIFIQTWNENPVKELEIRGHYQKYRDFNKYISLIESRGFKLIAIKKYPYWLKVINRVGAGLWVFKKEVSERDPRHEEELNEIRDIEKNRYVVK